MYYISSTEKYLNSAYQTIYENAAQSFIKLKIIGTRKSLLLNIGLCMLSVRQTCP